MGRKCIIDMHANRDSIETAALGGQALRDIARRYSTEEAPLSKDAVARHMAKCARPLVTKARAAGEAEELVRATSMREKVTALAARAERLLDAAETKGNVRDAVAALREAVRIATLLAEPGELQAPGGGGSVTNNVHVNVWTSPEWLAVVADLRRALAPHPDAYQAAIAVLSTPEGT